MSTDATGPTEVKLDKGSAVTGSTHEEQIVNARKNKKTPKPENLFLMLETGNEWNPMLGYPRNHYCPCGSQKKFKKCCSDKIPMAVTKEYAEKYSIIVKFSKDHPDWKWKQEPLEEYHPEKASELAPE
jgi:hypothetical protein